MKVELDFWEESTGCGSAMVGDGQLWLVMPMVDVANDAWWWFDNA